MIFGKRFLAAFAISVLLLGAKDVPAQIAQDHYVWRSVTVGAGGFIPGIVFSRLENGLAYLRSDMGGCYRWDDSQKQWIPLYDSFGESSYFGGESIALDPIDPNVVYVAAGMYRSDPSAMLRSRDRGRTWDVFPVTFRMGGNEDGRGVGERLAVDPNDNSILYFGSRHDGLWRSTDFAQTWQRVSSFPLMGRGNAGLSFVVFDPKSGARGSPTPTLFVGSADRGSQHLFRSDDAGNTWKSVVGEPKPQFLPAKADIDNNGILYITYSNGVGPNGVTDGAVMKLDTKSGQWTDITPDKRSDRGPGGYCGLSLDRQHPGTLGVTTMNRWGPSDTVWRTTDGGQTWMDIYAKSQRDVSASPFLLWGKDQAKLGWWMAAFAIDPFNSDHAVYATGATVFATDDFSNVSKDQPTHWYPWVKGIEQTAVLTLMSPTSGAPLLSGFGDIGGYVHDDLDVSPPRGMYENPQYTNTNTLDYAGDQPNVIVRSGRPAQGQAALGYSLDGGHSWQPLVVPADSTQQNFGRRRRGASAAVITSADGATFMVMTRTPSITRDDGKTWTKVQGLPPAAHPIADRVDPKTFYAIDFNSRKFYISSDAGATFAITESQGLPSDLRGDVPNSPESAWPLSATVGKQGDLWLITRQGLFHSSDSGKTFAKVDGGLRVEMISFGKAPEGKDYPALFAIGTMNRLRAVWRSDDAGASWVRVNDDQHEYGRRFRCIAGDPRIFGRVYIGTDGRGILYGEPVR
jgi:xyloglucan-specific exo-beta-1,4-glucanase